MTENLNEDPRVFFAAVRTVLAWVRTSLAMMGFGFVIARFGLFLRELSATQLHAAPHAGYSAWIGVVMVVFGSVACLSAAMDYRTFLKQHGEQPSLAASMSAWPVRVAVLMGLLGLCLAGYLASTFR